MLVPDHLLSLLVESELLIKSSSQRLGEVVRVKEHYKAENLELMQKNASLARSLELSELVDDMIDKGVISAGMRRQKLQDMEKSGYDPKVYREAMSLAANMPPIGELTDGEGEGEKVGSKDLLTETILSYLKSKQ